MTAVIESSLENLENSQPEKTIDLNLGEQRRHSFLPDSWQEDKRDTQVKSIGIVDFSEEDDLFMYMHSPQSYQEKPMQKFCTGSKYLGQWNRLGIAGKGVYKYPHGAIYDGYFNRNGEFHGTGILVYPNGHRIEGIWKNGKLAADSNFIAAAGVIMSKNYCLMPDRRFQVEFENEFNPVGQEYLTDEYPPARPIPEGCYDVVEGVYDPSIKSVIDYTSAELKQNASNTAKPGGRISTKFIFSGDEVRRAAFTEVSARTESEKRLEVLMRRNGFEENKVVSWIPSIAQEEWIVKNCRKAWDEHVGYRPDLYEEWTKGGRACSTVLEEEEEPDSKCKLRTLNLDIEHVPSKRFLSFVRNKKEDQETVTVDMLTKMFMKKTEIQSTMDIKMFSISRQAFQSEEVLVPETAT